MNCRQLIAGAVLAACTAGASAHVGMSPGATPGTFSFAGSTDESFTVSLAPGLYTSASMVFGFPFVAGFKIEDVSLTSAGFSQSFQRVTDTLFSYSGIISGGKTYSVNVDVSGTGVYGGGFHVSAVPEPETYALMLAGLGAIGFMVRRRKAD